MSTAEAQSSQRGNCLNFKNVAFNFLCVLCDLPAGKHHVKIPYNKTIYELCKKEFAKPDFKPWTEARVWEQVQKAL